MKTDILDLINIEKKIFNAGKIPSEYEVTRLSHSHRNEIVFFELDKFPYRCVTNILSNREDLYRILGVDNDLGAYEKILKAMKNPSDLNTVSFNDYFSIAELDMDSLPFIKYYREDGGYYLTSAIFLACMDNICNASYHRVMRIGKDKGVVRIVPRHLYHIMKYYHEKNKDLPVAVILGTHPLIELASSLTPSFGVFEISIGATLLGDNRVAKTPLYNIPVPIMTGIVLEGRITRETAWEGPFVDILRLVDPRRKQPIFELDAVYVSRVYEPFYHAIVPGLWEHILLMGFPREPIIYEALKKYTPNIKGIRLTMGSGGWLHAVVSIKQSKPYEARSIGLAVLYAHPSVKHVVVVDDDIDINDSAQVEWAIATRVRGGEDVIILRNMRGSTLDPRGLEGVGDKVVIDATKPFNEPWDKYRRVEIP